MAYLSVIRRRCLSHLASSREFLQDKGIPELSLSSILTDDILKRYPQQRMIMSEYSKSLHPGSRILSQDGILNDRFIKTMREFVPLMVLGNREQELKVVEIHRLLEVIKLMCLIRIALRIHETVNEDIVNESSNKKAILVGDFFLTLANNTAAQLEDPELFAFISQCSVNYIRSRFARRSDLGIGYLIGCGLLSAHRVTGTSLSKEMESTLKELGLKFGRLIVDSCARSHFEIMSGIRTIPLKNNTAKTYLHSHLLHSKL